MTRAFLLLSLLALVGCATAQKVPVLTVDEYEALATEDDCPEGTETVRMPYDSCFTQAIVGGETVCTPQYFCATQPFARHDVQFSCAVDNAQPWCPGYAQPVATEDDIDLTAAEPEPVLLASAGGFIPSIEREVTKSLLAQSEPMQTTSVTLSGGGLTCTSGDCTAKKYSATAASGSNAFIQNSGARHCYDGTTCNIRLQFTSPWLRLEGTGLYVTGGNVAISGNFELVGASSFFYNSSASPLIMSDPEGTRIDAAAATSGTTTQDSYPLTLRGTYWNGSASTAYDAEIVHDITGTGPASKLSLRIGGVERFYVEHDGDGVFQTSVYAPTVSGSTFNVSNGIQNLDSGEAVTIVDAEGLRIGSTGTNISKSVRASAALDFPSIAAQGCENLTITVTGAVTGSEVALGPPATLETGLVPFAFVSAADTVNVRVCNHTSGAIDPASATYSARTFAP